MLCPMLAEFRQSNNSFPRCRRVSVPTAAAAAAALLAAAAVAWQQLRKRTSAPPVEYPGISGLIRPAQVRAVHMEHTAQPCLSGERAEVLPRAVRKQCVSSCCCCCPAGSHRPRAGPRVQDGAGSHAAGNSHPQGHRLPQHRRAGAVRAVHAIHATPACMMSPCARQQAAVASLVESAGAGATAMLLCNRCGSAVALLSAILRSFCCSLLDLGAGPTWRCGERFTRTPSAARRCSTRSTPRGASCSPCYKAVAARRSAASPAAAGTHAACGQAPPWRTAAAALLTSAAADLLLRCCPAPLLS